MFSQDDIIEIYGFLPPEKQIQPGIHDELPLLIKTISGQGFVTGSSLRQGFEHMVTRELTRIPVSSASKQLGVDAKTISQLVRADPTLALLSRDQRNIIAKQERDVIVENLKKSLQQGVVIKNQFTEQYDVEVEDIPNILQVSGIKDSVAYDTDDYLLSKTYWAALSEVTSGKLVAGKNGLEEVKLGPQSLPGAPPTWLIRQCLDHLGGPSEEETSLLEQFYIEDRDDFIVCTPRVSTASRRDKLIADLQSGEMLWFSREEFAESFKELYTSPEDLDAYLSDIPSLELIDNLIISERKVSELAAAGLTKIHDYGFVHVPTILPGDMPLGIRSGAEANLMQRIQQETIRGNTSVRQGDYLLTGEKYGSQQQALLEFTELHAKQQWDLLKENSENEPKFQSAAIVASIPKDDYLLRHLAEQKVLVATASDHFASTISGFEIRNEHDFSTFWTEKALLRIHNYHEGVKAISDAKLHEQLSELLSSYLQKDFLPDIASRSRAQGLVCSRRTRKNLTRFEATLKTSKTEMSSIISTVEKFGKKQGLASVDTDAAEEAKKSLIQDMIRRMQKPKTDAPLMFLSLVLVLFSKNHPGVVYATGKFAPKLLKQLKTQLSNEDYEEAERLKELAKTGKLAKDDRERMVNMAEQVSPETQGNGGGKNEANE